MVVLLMVSGTATTAYLSDSISVTVRQIPLWEILWSIFNSWVNGALIQRVRLLSFLNVESTVPGVSIMPVNIISKDNKREFNFLPDCEVNGQIR
jgi:hypothetical protein